MADNVKWAKPSVDSDNPNLTTAQRFNNITKSGIRKILNKVRQGTAKPEFGEDKDGQLTYKDVHGVRIVVALEDRDHIIESMWKKHQYTGMMRLHSLLFGAYANICKNKLQRWWSNSANTQLHTKVMKTQIVRPVWASRVYAHL